MEQGGTHSESTSIKGLSAKNSQQRVDLHIRISRESCIFLKENFRNRFSETIDKLLVSLRTGKPIEIQIFRIESGSARIRTGDLLRVRET